MDADPRGFRPEARAPAALRPLFGELNDLKRLRSADREGSIATRLFAQGWAGLARGGALAAVCDRVAAAALAGARLGDLNGPKLVELGLSADEALEVLRRGFDEASAPLDPALAARLRTGLGAEPASDADAPPFVALLARQPRAGATCPGKPRIVLEPPENHAEHSLIVAVYGVLLSPAYGADPATVFLAGMAHHFHSAAMPDSGFTGEVLLGAHLQPVIDRATEAAAAKLAPALRAQAMAARGILADAATPEGRAFHAADVIDRVLQIAQHLRPGSIGMATVLDELELVHDGPVKPFHDRVLAEMGLP